MEDWAYGLVIVFCAAAWVHIFVDYRRKLMRVMPGVEQISSRKQEFNSKISEARLNTENIVDSIEDLKLEIVSLEKRRVELQEKVNEKEMIYIPPGKFIMGSNMPGYEDENPEHKIQLKGYYIDKYEVTNMQYKDFVDVTGYRAPIHWRNGTFPLARQANHPVTNVSWMDAKAYAEWMGKRLPTEAEWERAARGDHGNEYSWGKASSPDFANYADPDGSTTEVNKFDMKGASPFGVMDMCGNVGEWVEDWYEAKYYKRSPEVNPMGPGEGHQKVFRGGGYHTTKIDIRAARRHFAMPTTYYQAVGFRCAMDAD